MGGTTNKLTNKELENAKPGATTRRLSDGSGLYLMGQSMGAGPTALPENKNPWLLVFTQK